MDVILGFVLGSRVLFSDQKETQNQQCFGFTLFSRYPPAHVIIMWSLSPLLQFPWAVRGKEEEGPQLCRSFNTSLNLYVLTIKDTKQVAPLQRSVSIASFGAFSHR